MWTQIDSDRWQQSAPVRHFLLKAGTRYIELHGDAVHIYTGPGVVADPSWPLGNPAGEAPACTYLRSDTRADLIGADNITAWAALSDAQYTTG